MIIVEGHPTPYHSISVTYITKTVRSSNRGENRLALGFLPIAGKDCPIFLDKSLIGIGFPKNQPRPDSDPVLLSLYKIPSRSITPIAVEESQSGLNRIRKRQHLLVQSMWYV
jgi:hypothetical protein